MSSTYRGFARILFPDGRWHACVGGHSQFSAKTLCELDSAIDRHYMSLADYKAALARGS